MRRSKQVEVEVQITPMLDMAFQLLTFFILTYRPAPVEGQFAMNLLPPQPATKFDTPISEGNVSESSEVPQALRTLTTTLHASPSGQLASIELGEERMGDLDALRDRLAEILGDPNLPFDQALIQVDPDLRYEELMKVIDIFTSLKLTKISFSELGATPGI